MRAPHLARLLALLALAAPVATAAPIHTTYLWHMHQPIYWPERSTWNGTAYEYAYETMSLGHSQNDLGTIFGSDDRVHDYQDYPKSALSSVLDLPDAGAQVSFAGSLIQNLNSLGAANWNGKYGASWWQSYRDAMAWSTSGGRRRLDPVIVGMHHAINPLCDETVFRRELQAQKALMTGTWGSPTLSQGFFPAEMCFSERLIPTLVAEGVQWSIVPDVHIARACADYPFDARQDNCDPPNKADQVNPAQGWYYAQSISRGVTTKVPAPYGLRPHRAQYVNPATGAVSSLTVVPAANGMSWNEGYGLYGTGEIDAIAARNDAANPMLVLFAHDGDNAWQGGYSYFMENVTQFSHAAAGKGYEPTTVAEFLADHPVSPTDVVHVEDGGWVNADGDFGSPQYINWNWPLVNSTGQFDIPNGWAEDERNWAVLTAATNHVLTAEGVAGPPVAARMADPTLPGTTAIDKAWHFLLAGHESGYMYYGTSLDMEVKATLACNRAVEHAATILASAPDTTAPTLWLPQRLPWNPGGKGAGAMWGWPGGTGADMTQDFWVWTFAHDVSGVDTVRLVYRVDADGTNPIASVQNETYAGGAEVGAWQTAAMTRRVFPKTNVFNNPSISFTVLPTVIADEWYAHVTGLTDVLVDYYCEAVDHNGRIRRSPIQHVWVGAGNVTPVNPAVTWEPANPSAGGTITIHYDPVPGALADNTNPVYIHVGTNNWGSVVTPDPAMTWNAATSRFDHTYSIPLTATKVDFVFRSAANVWDNNGGADWHVNVSGAVSPPHTIDGTVDPGVAVVGACGGQNVYADYDGRWLYLAVPKSTTLDHFTFVSIADSTALRAAPWAKAGQVTGYRLMLANESTNGWTGWFDGAGTQPSAGLSKAAGTVLEALIDVTQYWASAPATLRLAFAAYGTADGGALTSQAPCGDGDGALEPGERAVVTPSSALAVDLASRAPELRLRLAGAHPVRGTLDAELDARPGEAVRVELLDLQGAAVRTLYEGVAPGALRVRANLAEGRAVAPGVYFLRAVSGARTASRRVVVLK
ncbi:MAG: hypothetical protein HZA61_01315 [Candidatus Eisenbacteria bacterium]|uniref:Carbohydrate binding module family 25 domain-containing protein n=1 Tax=Eiseniibacteriota bacterium TaxID=2212470 RepID=A0A933SAI6_UNCEI|nr:hypothetical protein [Candidatus Eisenbacteria bacterium]